MVYRRPRAVLDANVFLRIIFSKRSEGVAAALWQLLEQESFQLVTSEALLTELRDTLLVPELSEIHGWTAERIEDYLESIEEIAIKVPGTVATNVPELSQRDASDLPLISAALEGEAAIVTQDADLLDLAVSAAIPDVEILDPLDFLRRLRALQSRDER